MLSPLLRINNLRGLAMRASDNSLQVVGSLIHNAILNYEYFSNVSIRVLGLIGCTRTPKSLVYEILSGNFFD
jgi:hypothetical protein